MRGQRDGGDVRMSLIAMWTGYGREEGYPECCIEAFVADAMLGRYPADLRPIGADGRVMCERCAASPLMARQTDRDVVRRFRELLPWAAP